MKTKMLTIVFAMSFFMACRKDLHQSPEAVRTSSALQHTSAQGEQLANYVANEILVKFKKNISDQVKANAFMRINGTVKKRVLTRAMKHSGDLEGFSVVQTPFEVLDMVSKLKKLPEVEYAEPNYIYRHATVPDDIEYTNGNLWGMYGNGTFPINKFGSQAGEAWAVNHLGSINVRVGIIDEGAMYNHEDLVDNLKNTLEFKGVAGVDDDGNGFIDDIYGWDFYNNDNSTFDGVGDDHGTHVAGTIGAKGRNSVGVAGMCWNIRMVNAKFLGPFGGTTADAVEAVDYITDLKTATGHNFVATNNSWGGGAYSQALYDAINRANAADILFVAAAGNNAANIDAVPFYPASYNLPNVIAVAAINSTGALSTFSNFGPNTVSLGAPGEHILSTFPAAGGGSGYAYMDGTSMAAPHVTGAAALYASTHPGATAAQIKAAILNNTKITGSLLGITVTSGRLNVSGF